MDFLAILAAFFVLGIVVRIIVVWWSCRKRIKTIKPEGTVASIGQYTSGIHPHHAVEYNRRAKLDELKFRVIAEGENDEFIEQLRDIEGPSNDPISGDEVEKKFTRLDVSPENLRNIIGGHSRLSKMQEVWRRL